MPDGAAYSDGTAPAYPGPFRAPSQICHRPCKPVITPRVLFHHTADNLKSTNILRHLPAWYGTCGRPLLQVQVHVEGGADAALTFGVCDSGGDPADDCAGNRA